MKTAIHESGFTHSLLCDLLVRLPQRAHPAYHMPIAPLDVRSWFNRATGCLLSGPATEPLCVDGNGGQAP